MPALFRPQLLAAGGGLLLGAAGCQRVSYSLPSAALVTAPRGAGWVPPVAGVAPVAVALPTLPGSGSLRPQWRRGHHRATLRRPAGWPRLVAAGTGLVVGFHALSMGAKPHQSPGFIRHKLSATTAALNGNLGFHLLPLGVDPLLVAAGLAFGVGGWPAVLGGVTAAGAGLYLLLI